MSDFDIRDVPCASCQQGYAGKHSCDIPDYCPCDRTGSHLLASPDKQADR